MAVILVGCSNQLQKISEFAETTEINIDHLDSLMIQMELIESEYSMENTKLENKIKILNDRTIYYDSVIFDLKDQVEKMNDQLLVIAKGSQTEKSRINKELFSTLNISTEEYRNKYIESLSLFQNSLFNDALAGFNELLLLDVHHDLSDNAQYWIAEIFYNKKEYKRAISEFMHVFDFPETNKADHALFKLGLCYINIGDEQKAKDLFYQHMSEYPNSNHYNKSKKYAEQL